MNPIDRQPASTYHRNMERFTSCKFIVGLFVLLHGCGGTPSTSTNGGGPKTTGNDTAVLDHAASCGRTDAILELDSAKGTGAVSPMYGFASGDAPLPTDEEAVAYLDKVLASHEKSVDRLDPAVREKAVAMTSKLEQQRDVHKKSIEERKKREEESKKRIAESGNDPKVMRQEALKDAADFGFMGMLGREDTMGPAREGFFNAYLAFFDECATDLGISEKAQGAHRAIFPRKTNTESPDSR